MPPPLLLLLAVSLAAQQSLAVRVTGAIQRGTPLPALLKLAGVPSRSALRGNTLTGYLLASASGGHQVLFSLSELVPPFSSTKVLRVATGDPHGPFRFIDCTASPVARSVRPLTTLHVSYLKK